MSTVVDDPVVDLRLQRRTRCGHHNRWRYLAKVKVRRLADGIIATFRPDGTRIAPPLWHNRDPNRTATRPGRAHTNTLRVRSVCVGADRR